MTGAPPDRMETIMGTYDDLFSGDDCTRCALHRADVYLMDGEIDWFALA